MDGLKRFGKLSWRLLRTAPETAVQVFERLEHDALAGVNIAELVAAWHSVCDAKAKFVLRVARLVNAAIYSRL